MVDITCTRCGAEGTGFPTPYVAKFTLQHNTGCGAKIGIPKFSVAKPTLKEVEPVIHDTDHNDLSFANVTKPKKKRTAKKK